MLGSIWLLQSYLDPSRSDLLVPYFDPELRLRWSWLRPQCGVLAQELISRLERYRQTD